MGAWHSNTAANHNSTHFLVWSTGPLLIFFWSTGWEVISKFPSHSSLHEYLGTSNQEKALSECETSRRFVSSSRKSKSNNEGQCLTDCREVFPYTALSARRAHRLLIILVQAFYTFMPVCRNKEYENIYTIV